MPTCNIYIHIICVCTTLTNPKSIVNCNYNYEYNFNYNFNSNSDSTFTDTTTCHWCGGFVQVGKLSCFNFNFGHICVPTALFTCFAIISLLHFIVFRSFGINTCNFRGFSSTAAAWPQTNKTNTKRCRLLLLVNVASALGKKLRKVN